MKAYIVTSGAAAFKEWLGENLPGDMTLDQGFYEGKGFSLKTMKISGTKDKESYKMQRMWGEAAERVGSVIREKDSEIEELRNQLQWCKQNKGGWQKIGYMKNREAIYCDPEGEIAIEKEYSFLVDPSETEIQELQHLS